MTTISSLTQSALTQLNNLISSTALVQSQGGIPLREWKDELGRLRLWAGNIGAHRTGQSSLDYRLRDASHIRSQTIKILTAIGKLLRELHDTFNEDEVENEPLDEEIQDLVAGMDLADPSDIASTLRNAHERLTNMISQLFDISMTVRKPAQHDRLLGTARADGEPFKFHFRQHLSHKFPQSEIYLIDRISSAMAQQRAILKYRERHHLKLSQGLGLHDACDNDTVKLSETVASTFIPESLDHDLTSNSDTSFTSYAGSLLSGERLAIPALPKNATDQQPFECPYCFFIITIKNRQSWARHIFRDLSPYICVFARCSTQNRLYDSRKEWYGHIRQRHLTSQDVRGSYTCPLCLEGSLPNASFEKHVGRHLEELALFVLPRETEDDGVLDGEDGSVETESDVESRGEDHPLTDSEALSDEQGLGPEGVGDQVHSERMVGSPEGDETRQVRESQPETSEGMDRAAIDEWKLAEMRRRSEERRGAEGLAQAFQRRLEEKFGGPQGWKERMRGLD